MFYNDFKKSCLVTSVAGFLSIVILRGVYSDLGAFLAAESLLCIALRTLLEMFDYEK